MRWDRILASGALLGGVLALPSSNHVLHERRHIPLRGRRERIAADAVIPVRIGLKQSNLHLGYDRLMELSHPDSARYGQHLSAEEVHDLFAPAVDTVQAVKAWLVDSGIKENDILSYTNKGWLAIDVPAKVAERLFSTSYYEHELGDGSRRIGCDEYHLPHHVSKHVDFIKPGVKLSAPLKKRTVQKRGIRGRSQWPGRPSPPGPGHMHPNPSPHWSPPYGIPEDLQTCAVNITPTCIKALYDIPEAKYHDPANAMGLYETYDSFSQADIGIFFANYAPNVPHGTSPKVISVDGGTAPVAASSERNGGESDIDVDLATSLIYPQSVTVYEVDDLPNSSGETNVTGFLNTFLDSVDGSYCNYTAYGITGDSPGIDATYPDTSGLPGAYTGPLECGTYSLTRVVSISYGEAEVYLPKPYVERQCNEIMKLGLQGHSILVAAGDYGVASFPGSNGDAYGCLSGHGQNGTIYNPDYPSGCPYITAVGATRLYENDTVYDAESAMQVNLTAFNVESGEGSTSPVYQFFASGGGFSNYFTPPSYQAEAVANYLARYAPDVPSYSIGAAAPSNVTSMIGADGGVYNRAGRGYPDVSANGAFLLASVNLTIENWFGTSLASPIFGSVLTLLNEARTAVGKGPVGFVNPVLYANPQVLHDITNGSNPNCGSSGFTTAPGWDPVTGLGTPDYPKMLDLWLRLP
ncbi:putative protease S8 tripeptidyl peptidase I [Teratosphaeria destructans]|uniref:Protease S8 tripeptidyl peptidase I n=1 Tax=Teratosphaeria destructans TaxID=418781 RepID=A0A9W7SZ81_9PEZI|nr:putative protease S8 tripeptidyl peptidase I [Teratosphaeria destructans]